MKRTDRYILRQFAQTFIFGLLAFIIIFIVVDLIENLDEFSDKNVGFGTIGLYYLYYVPEMIKLVAPIGMLLASLFTFTRLDTQAPQPQAVLDVLLGQLQYGVTHIGQALFQALAGDQGIVDPHFTEHRLGELHGHQRLLLGYCSLHMKLMWPLLLRLVRILMFSFVVF